MHRLFVAGLLTALAACGDDTSPPEVGARDGGVGDAPLSDGGGEADASPPDLAGPGDTGARDGGRADLGRPDAGAILPPEIVIPAGTFTMGNDRFGDRERQVTLTRAFAIQAHEVTQAEWSRFFPDNPSGSQGPDLPVERVSWYDALAYANALSAAAGLTACYDLSDCSGRPGQTGFGAAYLCPENLSFDLDCPGYRLLTEAEWEYAAGLSPDPNLVCDGDANIDLPSSRCGVLGYSTETVRARNPDGTGLYGMQSNVAEWIWDRLDNYRGDMVTDPTGPNNRGDRITRGGGWRFNARSCRITHRSSRPDSCQADSLGLRMARSLSN